MKAYVFLSLATLAVSYASGFEVNGNRIVIPGYGQTTSTTTFSSSPNFKISRSPTGQLQINGVPTSSYNVVVNGKKIVFSPGEDNGIVVDGIPINVYPGQEKTLNLNGVTFTFTGTPNKEILVSQTIQPKPIITINPITPTTYTITPTTYTIYFNGQPAKFSLGPNNQIVFNGIPIFIPPGRTITININGKPAKISLGPNNVIIINRQPITSTGQTITINPPPTIYTVFINGEPITVSTGEQPGIIFINGQSITVPTGHTITISINGVPTKITINITGEIVINGKPITENGQEIPTNPTPAPTQAPTPEEPEPEEVTVAVTEQYVAKLTPWHNGKFKFNGKEYKLQPGETVNARFAGNPLKISLDRNKQLVFTSNTGLSKQLIKNPYSAITGAEYLPLGMFKRGDPDSVYHVTVDDVPLTVTFDWFGTGKINGNLIPQLWQTRYTGGSDLTFSAGGKTFKAHLNPNFDLYINDQLVDTN